MKQYLPLNYFEMIIKYMLSKTDDNMFEITYDGVVYELDVLGEEEDGLVRIKSKDTNQSFNVSKYDYQETHMYTPELFMLLNHIESITEFTLTDWVNHYTKNVPIYNGRSLIIYKTPDDGCYYIQSKSDGLLSYYMKNGVVHYIENTACITVDINGGINLELPQTTLTSGASGHVDSNEFAATVLETMFNTELMLSHANYNVKLKPTLINESVWANSKSFQYLDLIININGDDKSINYELGKCIYTINSVGQLSITNVIDKKTKPLRSDCMFSTYMHLNRYITNDDQSFANVIVSVLNQALDGDLQNG